MIKKLFILNLIIVILFLPAFCADKYSREYLISKRHIAVINPAVECAVAKAIKKQLKKETGANFKVTFKGYTTSSMKKGIFKYLALSGKNFLMDGIPIEYAHLSTLTDYNYIDYKKNPVEYKSDMTFAYDLTLNEDSINTALQNKKYKKVIDKINKYAYPIFMITGVKTKIDEDKLYIIMDYNFPIVRASHDRTFITSSNMKVEKGKIIATNVHIDSKYGNLGSDRVANLINLLNPLEFTLDLMETKQCSGNVENVNIVDNKIKVNGKIFIKGDEK